MAKKIFVSVVQMKPRLLAPEFNRAQMNRVLSRVNSDLIVFPELCSSGYNFSSTVEARRVAEPGKDGETARLLRLWAKRKNCAIVAGFPESSGRNIYNSAIVARPDSTVIVRKIHLFARERTFFRPGEPALRVFEFKNVRFGVMICFDWFFPEVMRALAVNGADLVVHPSNLVMPYAPDGMKTRSLENHVYSATANRVGSERGLMFTGRSQILSPKGAVLGRLSPTKTGVLTVGINPRNARHKYITPVNHVLNDRRVGFRRGRVV